MRDFTLKTYKKLLTKLIQAGYGFITFEGYIQSPDKKEKAIILRHDVDKKPLQSLRTAEIENELEIKGAYYFRVVRNEFPKEVIECIAKLGHEVGYHYDDLNAADGVLENAQYLFKKNLAKLREVAPVKTACMHGSPLSKHDNREMWKDRSYKEFGIIGEPYFDIDFNEVAYLTDTGRMWDGDKVSIRDKVISNGLWVMGKRKDRGQKEIDSRGAVCDPPVLCLHSTMDIIKALRNNQLPDKIMLTIHPQRWTDNDFLWIKELIWQKFKNLIKYMKIKRMEKIGKK